MDRNPLFCNSAFIVKHLQKSFVTCSSGEVWFLFWQTLEEKFSWWWCEIKTQQLLSEGRHLVVSQSSVSAETMSEFIDWLINQKTLVFIWLFSSFLRQKQVKILIVMDYIIPKCESPSLIKQHCEMDQYGFIDDRSVYEDELPPEGNTFWWWPDF